MGQKYYKINRGKINKASLKAYKGKNLDTFTENAIAMEFRKRFSKMMSELTLIENDEKAAKDYRYINAMQDSQETERLCMHVLRTSPQCCAKMKVIFAKYREQLELIATASVNNRYAEFFEVNNKLSEIFSYFPIIASFQNTDRTME